jgi:hypothetical protein
MFRAMEMQGIPNGLFLYYFGPPVSRIELSYTFLFIVGKLFFSVYGCSGSSALTWAICCLYVNQCDQNPMGPTTPAMLANIASGIDKGPQAAALNKLKEQGSSLKALGMAKMGEMKAQGQAKMDLVKDKADQVKAKGANLQAKGAEMMNV